MKEYIKLTKRDALAKEYEQSRYIGVIILGLVGGYFGALALTRYLTLNAVWSNEAETSRQIPQHYGIPYSMEYAWPQVSDIATFLLNRDTTKTFAGSFSTNTSLRQFTMVLMITKYRSDIV